MPEGSEPLILWRAYVPKWAYLPLSGEGSARFGGRWNPKGVPAIYAARELSTAWAEYNQGFVQHPALIVQLELSGAQLADLTDTTVRERLGIEASIHDCEWRADKERGVVPATHAVYERLAALEFNGVVYPSFMSRGGNCVALWHWNEPGKPLLRVIDPDGLLPTTPRSWLPGES